jgi:HAD superfamily hydrolase (TIGR01490 family)
MKKRKVAVFDIDGTIFRSSLLIELVEELIRREIFPQRARRGFEPAYKKWIERKGEYEAYIGAVVSAFVRYSKGVAEKDFLDAIRRVHAVHHDRVYRFTRDLVRELKRKKYFLLAISHSPKYIAEGFAKKLGFHKVYGRYLELDESKRFTGFSLHEELIGNKAEVLRRAIQKENLTLRDSVGVGDTESDVPFLKLVERPICFNPNRKLYQTAKRRGWQVVVERKDVIYKI